MNDQTIIIGGGPAGASAAIYLARFRHPVSLIDAGEAVPGRTSMATSLRNFLGHTTAVSGGEFLGRIKNQLSQYSIEQIADKVVKVEKRDDQFTVTTEAGKSLTARYLIVAVGCGDNMPTVDALDDYYDSSIFHCLTCEWYEHRQRKAAVIAVDDRGLNTALMLTALERPPSLVVVPATTPNFSSDLINRCQSVGIQVYQSPLQELKGADGQLHALILADGTEVTAEVLFTKLGHVRFDNFLDAGGAAVEREPKEGFIVVDFRTFESSLTNLFAVGPCNDGPDQAIIGAGQGAMAALEIHSRILR